MSIEQLIKEAFNKLSSGQKKVAEYLLQNLEKAAFSTAVQIGREADVSETTVMRLSYALGFSGFSEMQSLIQKHVLAANTAKPYGDVKIAQKEENPFANVMERELTILKQTYNQLNLADVWKAVDWLMEADSVLVVGYRASFAAAHWLSFMLSEIRNNVSLCSASDEVPKKVATLSDKSVVFVISYPRYTKETVKVTEFAKQRGARVISATDRVLSPVGRLSDLTFTTEINVESGFNSIATVVSLLNLIMTGIGMKNQKEIQTRRQGLEELYSSLEVFVE